MAAMGLRKLVDIGENSAVLQATLERFLQQHQFRYERHSHLDGFIRYYVRVRDIGAAKAVIPALLDLVTEPKGRRAMIQSAKRAYEIWAFRISDPRAWERLSNREQAAWIDTVEFIEDDIPDKPVPCTCPSCATLLLILLWFLIGVVVAMRASLREQIWLKDRLQVDLMYVLLGPIGIWRRME